MSVSTAFIAIFSKRRRGVSVVLALHFILN